MSLVIENLVLPLADFTLKVDVKLTAAVTGLTGPSGAGKTTLLELIAGLRRPEQGSIRLDGGELTSVASRCFLAPEKRRVGYVPQDLALFPHLDVRANLCYGLRQDESGLLGKVVEVLELPTLLKRSIAGLSGGEKQRVALGRALLAGPRILLLDEPLSNLDDRLKEKILPYLHRIRREFAVPMIYVSHSKAELGGLCDEVLVMREGKIEEG
ncbi:MAG: ATP-binding cassette domain-containing protein [Luteolibacter sp.]